MTQTIVFQESEIWRPVVSYDGIFKDAYQVSNWGRVRSVDRWIEYIQYTKKVRQFFRGKILAQHECRIYLAVMLQFSGYMKHPCVQKLVADAFPEICGTWFPGADVDHKNGNPHDNRAENLEYKTHKENCNNPITLERKSKAMRNYEKFSKPVMQYTKDGQFIAEYPSLSEAERQTGTCFKNISRCCLNNRPSAGGFVWKFDNR